MDDAKRVRIQEKKKEESLAAVIDLLL